MSLIEKIARAMAASDGNPKPDLAADEYKDLAQAALTAIMDAGDGVQQCDREAAKSLLGRDDAGPSWWSIDSGNADSDPLVQAFAHHRSTAAAAERARIVAWLRGEATQNETDGNDGHGLLNYAADAIERGEL